MSRVNSFFSTLRHNWLATSIVAIVFVVILIFSVVYATQKNSLERKTRIQYTPNEQSKLNPFYAAELFLEKQYNDRLVTSYVDMDLDSLIDELPDLTQNNNDNKYPTLIIRSLNEGLSDSQQQSLMDWMADGGHLIVFTSGSKVSYEDWKPIEGRIHELQSQSQKTSNKISDLVNDQKLKELLGGLDSEGKNTFLRKLNVYQVEAYKYSNEDETNINRFNKELIPFKLTDEKKAQEDSKISIDNDDIKSNLEHFNRQNLYFTIPDKSKSPLQLENTNTRIVTDLLYANNPEVKQSSNFKPVSIVEIRAMLAEQLVQADKLVKESEDLSKKLDTHWYALNALEMQKTLQIMQKLSDERLLSMFNVSDRAFVDNDFGKGRLTIVSDNYIWNNPKQVDLDHAQKIQESTAKPPTIFHNSLYSLYDHDNASLLLALTKNSSEIWLFPNNVDIDNLPMLLWKKARFAVLGLMLLCFVWLWSLYNKFGKHQVLATTNDSDISLYFHQIGLYGWEYDRAKLLSKITRTHSEKLAKKVLGLKTNETLMSNHMPELSKVLRSRLDDKLSQKLMRNSQHEELLSMIKANKTHVLTLLTPEQLKESLLPTSNDLNSFTALGFTDYTQTLWLVKWLSGEIR